AQLNEKQAEGHPRDESFGELIGREGARIVEDVRKEQLAATSMEVSEVQEELATKDALMREALDELQIAEELRGRVLANYFYSYTSGGREIHGISWAGIKWIAREMARRGEAITIEKLEFEEGQDDDGPWMGFLARARNLLTNEIRFGYAAQSRNLKFR